MGYLICWLCGMMLGGFFYQPLSMILFAGSFLLLLYLKRQALSYQQAGAFILCVFLGAGYAQLHYRTLEKTYSHVEMEAPCEVLIVSAVTERENGVQFEGRMTQPYSAKVLVEVSYEGMPFLSPYDKIALTTGKVSSFSKRSWDSSFDYQQYMYAKGLRLSVQGQGRDVLLLHSEKNTHFLKGMLNFRSKIDGLLYRYFESEPYMLLNGILLGDGEIRSREFNEVMALTGLSHVVVVSGMHFSILVLFLSMLLRRLGMGRKSSAYVIVVFSFLLALFIGFSPSVIRAFSAVLILCLADILERERSDSFYFLLLTALGMLLYNPYLSYHLGFLLSFASISGILLYSQHFEWKEPRVPKLLRETVSLSLGASIPTLPLIAYGFSRISLVFLAGNLLLTPLISFLMLWSFLVIAAGFFHLVLGYYIALPLNYFLKGLLFCIRGLAQLPFASISVMEISPTWVLAFFLFLLIFALRPFLWRKRLLLVLFLTLSATLFYPVGELLYLGVHATVSGGGESGQVVLSHRGKTLVMDLSEGAGEQGLQTLLAKKGKEIQWYILRGEKQFSTLLQLLEEKRIKTLYYPAAMEENPYYRERLKEIPSEKIPVYQQEVIQTKDFHLTVTAEKGYNISVVEIHTKKDLLQVVADFNHPFLEGEAYVITPGIRRMLKNQQRLEELNILNHETKDYRGMRL